MLIQSVDSKGLIQNVESKGLIQNVESKGLIQNVESKGLIQNVESKGLIQSVESKWSMLLRLGQIFSSFQEYNSFPSNTRRSPNAGFMLGRRRGLWTNKNPALSQHFVPVLLIMFITLNPSIITVPPEYLITHHYFLGCIKYIFSIALTLRENIIINIKKKW